VSDLSHHFDLDDLDHCELLGFLFDHFRRGNYPRANVVGFGDKEGTLVDVRLDDDGGITAIDTGSTFNQKKFERLLERYRQVFEGPTKAQVAGRVLFLEWRLGGSYCWRDTMRVRDLVPTHPGTEHLPMEGPHPVLLEAAVCVPEAADCSNVTIARTERVVTEFQWLLALVLRCRVEGPPRSERRIWVMSDDDPPKPQYLTLGYWPWTLSMADVPKQGPAPLHEPLSYYAEAGPVCATGLPNNIDDLIDRFCSVTGDSRERFTRAIAWFATGIASWHACCSHCYLGLFNAVEALSHTPAQEPTRSFKDFLKTHAPFMSKSVADDICTARSLMVHQGHLFDADRHPWRWGWFSDIQHDQLLGAVAGVRGALINWLLSQEKGDLFVGVTPPRSCGS
jgi:hypothetical protein